MLCTYIMCIMNAMPMHFRRNKEKTCPNNEGKYCIVCCNINVTVLITEFVFVLRFYGPVNPMGSCRARSVYLTTRLLGRLSPLSG